MIPVAYDNASATVKPQLPNAGKLVLTSLYYGVMHTILGLGLIFVLGNPNILQQPLDLTNNCNISTRGFIWLHLCLVTEFAIFSVRAPSFFFLSMPSPILIGSVLISCAGATIVAVLYNQLPGDAVAWIWVFNIIVFVIIDLIKVPFREVIDDTPGDVIASDELIKAKPQTETEKHMEKGLRNIVHRRSTQPVAEMEHQVEIVQENRGIRRVVSAFGHVRQTNVTDGFSLRQSTRRVKQWSNASSAMARP